MSTPPSIRNWLVVGRGRVQKRQASPVSVPLFLLAVPATLVIVSCVCGVQGGKDIEKNENTDLSFSGSEPYSRRVLSTLSSPCSSP
jgi:hypothetical protein